MALRLNTGNRAQNAPTSSDAAVKALKDANTAGIRWEDAKKNAVKVVNAYRDSLPRGERKEGVIAVCKKAGIDYSTYKRWKAELGENDEIGNDVFREAAKENVTVNTLLRSELLKVKREHPNDPAKKVLQTALENCKVKQETKPQPESLRSKACKAVREYLMENGDKENWSAEIAGLASEVYADYDPCGSGA
jgi:hypothetical protein